MTELAKNSPKPEKENGDYISRRDAIDKLRVENGIVDDGLIYVPLRDVRNHLRSLPPAQPEAIHCRECEKWCQGYFCKTVFHPTKADDTCESVLGAKRKGERRKHDGKTEKSGN